MPKLTPTPNVQEAEPCAEGGNSKIARWSRMAVFASALSATPACAEKQAPIYTPQPQYAMQPQPQYQQPAPQPEAVQSQPEPMNNLVNPDAMLALVINDPKTLNETDDELKNDRDFMKTALEKTTDPSAFVQLAPVWVRQDKEMMLTAMQRNTALLQFADNALKNDQLFMMRAIMEDGQAIKYAAKKLQNDRAMAMAAITQDGRALETLKEFADDKDFVLKAIKQNPTAFQYADEKFRNDGNMLMVALRQTTSNYFVSPLKFTSPELKRNRLIVLMAINQDSRALEFADPILKKDKEVVLTAAQQDEATLEFADPSIREAVRKEIQAKKKMYNPQYLHGSVLLSPYTRHQVD